MSDADIVRRPLLIRQNDTGAQDVREALAALTRMVEREKLLVEDIVTERAERDRLSREVLDWKNGARLRDVKLQQTEELREVRDRLKDQLAQAIVSVEAHQAEHADTLKKLAEEHSRALDAEAALANADANGLRLAEESERLVEDKFAAEHEVERLRARLAKLEPPDEYTGLREDAES